MTDCDCADAKYAFLQMNRDFIQTGRDIRAIAILCLHCQKVWTLEDA